MSDLFAPLFKRKSILLNEADDENSTGENTGGADQAADTNTEGNNNDTGGETGTADNDSDFDINIDDTGMTDDSGGGEDTGGDNGGTTGNPESQVDPNSENKKKDRELFDSLTLYQQKVKTVELKKLYMDLYDRCEQLAEKYDTLGVEYEDIGDAIAKSLKSLYEMKTEISTYLLYLFDSNTYYENDIQFNQFLVALNRIRLVADEMVRKHKEQIEAVKSATPLNDKDIEREKSN